MVVFRKDLGLQEPLLSVSDLGSLCSKKACSEVYLALFFCDLATFIFFYGCSGLVWSMPRKFNKTTVGGYK